MVALKGKSDIGDKINKKIIAPLASAIKLSAMPDFNDATKLGSGKEMVDRLASIRLNTDLAKKPPECLEYIVVHEMIHLLEPTHNNRFMNLMEQFIPNWRFYRTELNRLPVKHEDWSY